MINWPIMIKTGIFAMKRKKIFGVKCIQKQKIALKLTVKNNTVSKGIVSRSKSKKIWAETTYTYGNLQ